jgi:hypothetical protein
MARQAFSLASGVCCFGFRDARLMQTMRFLQSPPKSGMQTRATVETLYHGWPELHSLSMDSGKQAVTMEFGRV